MYSTRKLQRRNILNSQAAETKYTQLASCRDEIYSTRKLQLFSSVFCMRYCHAYWCHCSFVPLLLLLPPFLILIVWYSYFIPRISTDEIWQQMINSQFRTNLAAQKRKWRVNIHAWNIFWRYSRDRIQVSVLHMKWTATLGFEGMFA